MLVSSPSTTPPSTASPSTGRARRTLAELVDLTSPGWPVVADWIAQAANRVEVLPVDPEAGERALLAIQVTTRSPMGAIAHATGGILVDHGWIRVLGGGNARLPRDLGTWNFPARDGAFRLVDALLVADDALGGFFALNGGAFEGPLGNVFYLAPDTLEWEDLECGYSGLLRFLFQGDVATFYEGQRWSGWVEDVGATVGDRAFSIFPFLSVSEGGPIDARSRKAVPVEELWMLHAVDLPKQLSADSG